MEQAMNFYRRRPFALAVTLGIPAAAAAAYLREYGDLIPFIAVLFAVTALVVLRRWHIYTICGMKIPAFVVLFVVTAMAMLISSLLYFEVYAAPYDQSMEAEIRGTVVERASEQSYCTTYKVRLETVNGEKLDACGLLYTETDMGMEAGARFRADVEFMPLAEFYEDGEDSVSQLLADGIVFTCESREAIDILGHADTLEGKIVSLRSFLEAKLSLYLDYDATALSKALLLGDRSDLQKVRRDFEYAGISHLLAISGLHLSILCGVIKKLLDRFGVLVYIQHGVIIVFILFYTALLGFPVAVMRSAIMLILSFAARWIMRKEDNVTALFTAGFLILVVDPAAILDRAFALSFTATLGVLLFTLDWKRFCVDHYGESKESRHLYQRLSAPISCVGALMFVLPLQWMYFGEVSLLSIPATLLLTPFVEAILTLLLFYLPCSLLGLHFLCGRLGWLILVLTKTVEILTGWMAELSPLISLRYFFVPVLIVMLVGVFLYMASRKFYYWIDTLIPFALACMIFSVGVGICQFALADNAALTFVSNGSDEVLILRAGNQYVVVDATSGARSGMYKTVSVLREKGGTSIDTLILTHIHRRHVSGIRTLLSRRVIRSIILPQPVSEYEENLLLDLQEAVEPYHVTLRTYSRGEETTIRFPNVSVELPAYHLLGRSVHPLVAVRFETEKRKLSYCGGSAWENAYIWDFVSDTDLLLIGAHGPLYKTPPNSLPSATVHVGMTHPMATLGDAAGFADMQIVNKDVRHYELLP